ncbi:MAG: MBL fold metallo-hydrolase [Treponema sp.]|nr:MBL fold metallo-hydrolase [Treponema sp.]
MIYAIRTGPLSVSTYIVELCASGAQAAKSTGGGYAFIVDPAACSFCGDQDVITDFLRKQNLTPVAIVLTHGHFDHVSGLKHLRDCYPKIPILIHKEDSKFIGAEGGTLQGQSLMEMGFDDFIPSVTNLPEATDFLEDGKNLRECAGSAGKEQSFEGMEDWQVIHTPGHTPGSVCLYNSSQKLLLSGDTVFYRSWGRTDLPLGSEAQIQESLRHIYSTLPSDTKVYPGHDINGFKISENI